MSGTARVGNGFLDAYQSQIELLKKDPNATTEYKAGLDKQFDAIKAQYSGSSTVSDDDYDLDADNGYSSGDEHSTSTLKPETTGTPSTTTPSTGTAPTKTPVNAGDTAGYIAGELHSKLGLNDKQIAGVLGNLQQESGLESNILQGGAHGPAPSSSADDNQHGYGLVQWSGSRLEGLNQYARQNNLDPSGKEAQVGFMIQELKGPYSGALSALKQTNTITDATTVFCKQYEIASEPYMDSRINHANNFLPQLSQYA